MSAQLMMPYASTSNLPSTTTTTTMPIQGRLTELALFHIQQREWKPAIEHLNDRVAQCASDNNESARALFLRGRCLWNHAIEDWQKSARLGNTEAQTQLSVLIRSLEHEKLRPRLLSRLSRLQERLHCVPPEIIDVFRELHQIDQGITSANALAQLRETVDTANSVLQNSPRNHFNNPLVSTPLPASNSADQHSPSLDSLTKQLSAIEIQLRQARQAQQLLQKAIQDATAPTTTTTTSSSSSSSFPVSVGDYEEHNARRICYEALNLEVRRKRREKESASRLVLQARAADQQIESVLIPQMQQSRSSLLRDLAQSRQTAERIHHSAIPPHPTSDTPLVVSLSHRKRPTDSEGTSSDDRSKRRKTM